MRYLSLFSGIEAASVAWEPLGWTCVGVAEVEPFPCRLLAHHYPDIPNLGDVTKITREQILALGHIDVVIGGSPCQAFSVAGLRKGLNDPRGNLMLEFLRIVELAQARYVVWENVHGVLSDKTNAFGRLLDGFGELGYSVDPQILDAQEFGLAQRRRRVFVVCQKDERNKGSFENIGKILIMSLGELSSRTGNTRSDSVLWGVSLAPMPEMLRLMGMPDCWSNDYGVWCDFWDRYLRDAVANSNNPSALSGIVAPLLGVMGAVGYAIVNSDEPTDSDTAQRIYSFVCAVSVVSRHVLRLLNPPETLFGAESLFLLAIQEIMKYARQKNVKRFIENFDTSVLNRSRAHTSPLEVIKDIGDWWDRSVLLSESESVSRDTSQGREKKKGVAKTAVSGTHGDSGEVVGTLLSGSGNTSLGDGHLIVMATGSTNAELLNDMSPTLTCSHEQPIICYALAGNTKEASYTLTNTDRHVVCYRTNSAGQVMPQGDISASLTCFTDPTAQFLHQEADEICAYPINLQTATRHKSLGERTGFGVGNEGEPSYTLQAGHCLRSGGSSADEPDSTTYVGHATTRTTQHGIVRRLLPIECERLQGFPDGWTDITKGSDSVRYKALGNSMAVPVIQWIGRSIDDKK